MARKKFFGEYLIEKGLITDADVLEILTAQRKATISFERMACDLGIMGVSQAFKVLTLQAETDLDFMEVALQHEIIDKAQAELTLASIESVRPAVGEMLVLLEKLDKETVERELTLFECSVAIHDDVKGLLKEIYLFKNLDEVALRALANIVSVSEYDADHFVVKEGQQANSLFAVTSGSLMITKINSDNDQDSIYVGNIQTKEVFGESAVFEGGRRTASVITCDKTTLLEIERKEFQKFLYSHSAKTQSILLFLISQLVEKLSDLNHEHVKVCNRFYATQDLGKALE
ncbi:MAG: cyclic nucleotide-binding domain-containing protein [Candidatus Sedimenticola sp. (ex Thyasira tokunagai)]